MGGLFGSSAKPSTSRPYQGPQFNQGLDLLTGAVFGGLESPQIQSSLENQVTSLQSQLDDLNSQRQSIMGGPTPTYRVDRSGEGMNRAIPTQTNSQINDITRQLQDAQNRLNTYNSYQGAANQFQPTFTQAGQQIQGQIQPTINANSFVPQFQQRQAYQFAQPSRVSVADIFTPNIGLAQQALEEQRADAADRARQEMNRLGLLQSGQTIKQLQEIEDETSKQLANQATQLATQQSLAQQQEEQAYRDLLRQRELSQAEELFRQQGATDQQAQLLAQFGLQGAQTGFQQQLAGRQQAIAEEQLANQLRRLPLEDLFRLQLAQMGQISTGGTPATSGIGGLLGSAAGSFLGPVGTAAGTAAGRTLFG